LVGLAVKRKDPFLCACGIAGILVAACGPKASPSHHTYSWVVDCVAVLGIPPPSDQTPLEAIPLSGLPRDRFISALTHDELVTLSDYDACVLNNGYERTWFDSRDANTDWSGYPTTDPNAALYQDETLACLENLTETVYATPNDELPGASGIIKSELKSTLDRNERVDLLQNYFGTCQVGPWEDCTRAIATGYSVTSTACHTTHTQCDVP
jgi:hypothetical protein